MKPIAPQHVPGIAGGHRPNEGPEWPPGIPQPDFPPFPGGPMPGPDPFPSPDDPTVVTPPLL